MKEGFHFTRTISFPNGKGYTPCTEAYYAIYQEVKAIYDPSTEYLDDLTPEEYQRWNELTDKLAQMQLEGQLGSSVRYSNHR